MPGTAPPILYLLGVAIPTPVHGSGNIHGWPHLPDESTEELPCRPPLIVNISHAQTLP